MSPQQPPVRRFGINPVEILIFSVVGLVFANSVYSLFKEREQIHGASLALVQSTTLQIDGTSGGRAPASMGKSEAALGAPGVEKIDIPCALTPFEYSTTAEKIQMTGKLCSSSSRSVEVRGKTVSGRYPAQVVDQSLDYEVTQPLILQPGKNDFVLEFKLSSGKKIQRELVIFRK